MQNDPRITELKRKLDGLDKFSDDEIDKEDLRQYYMKQLKELGMQVQ